MPRVCGTSARTQLPRSVRTQSEELRMTMPIPAYAQNDRLLANRYGVTTIGNICATRIAPIPGHVFSRRKIACLRASLRICFPASATRSFVVSSCW